MSFEHNKGTKSEEKQSTSGITVEEKLPKKFVKMDTLSRSSA